MIIKIYEEIPQEAKTIREAVFMKEQGFKDEFDEIDQIIWRNMWCFSRRIFRWRPVGSFIDILELSVRDNHLQVIQKD